MVRHLHALSPAQKPAESHGGRGDGVKSLQTSHTPFFLKTQKSGAFDVGLGPTLMWALPLHTRPPLPKGTGRGIK